MKCIFQLVARETGVRSQPVIADRFAFAAKLSVLFPEGSDDYVLVICDNVGSDTSGVSVAPLMTITTFCALKAEGVSHV